MPYRGKFYGNLAPNPQRWSHLPAVQNPYSGVSPCTPEGRDELYARDDEGTKAAKKKPRGMMTAREMGRIGGRIGGPIVRYLIELGKAVEYQRLMRRLRVQEINLREERAVRSQAVLN